MVGTAVDRAAGMAVEAVEEPAWAAANWAPHLNLGTGLHPGQALEPSSHRAAHPLGRAEAQRHRARIQQVAEPRAQSRWLDSQAQTVRS